MASEQTETRPKPNQETPKVPISLSAPTSIDPPQKKTTKKRKADDKNGDSDATPTGRHTFFPSLKKSKVQAEDNSMQLVNAAVVPGTKSATVNDPIVKIEQGAASIESAIKINAPAGYAHIGALSNAQILNHKATLDLLNTQSQGIRDEVINLDRRI